MVYPASSYQVYNCILRRFPRSMYEVFERNSFSTTISVLVSAVHKIARTMKIRSGLVLYAGLGGLMELPEGFWRADARGCKGYVEWGFRSTTSDKAVALQYSGVQQGRPLAMVMEIVTSSIDRGACIRDFSQYPAEVEYLWVPCSYLEPSGNQYLEVTPHGLVTVLPVRANANLITSTIEELVGEKRRMHLASFRYLIDELERDLQNVADEGNASSRWEREATSFVTRANDPSGKFAMPTVSMFLAFIVEQVRDVYRAQEALDPKRYVSDETFRALVIEMLEAKMHAQSKLNYWLEDEAQKITTQGMDGNGDRKLWSNITDLSETLRGAHIGWMSFLEGRSLELEGQEKVATALRLCKLKGFVKESVDETNKDGENAFVQAANNSMPLEALKLLMDAGADIDGTGSGKETAMFAAARKGNVLLIERLFELGSQLERRCNGVLTPLMTAASNGHITAMRKLVELGADVNLMTVPGCTALCGAKRANQSEAVKVLQELGATR